MCDELTIYILKVQDKRLYSTDPLTYSYCGFTSLDKLGEHLESINFNYDSVKVATLSAFTFQMIFNGEIDETDAFECELVESYIEALKEETGYNDEQKYFDYIDFKISESREEM